jgi:hypothetical protein
MSSISMQLAKRTPSEGLGTEAVLAGGELDERVTSLFLAVALQIRVTPESPVVA